MERWGFCCGAVGGVEVIPWGEVHDLELYKFENNLVGCMCTSTTTLSLSLSLSFPRNVRRVGYTRSIGKWRFLCTFMVGRNQYMNE